MRDSGPLAPGLDTTALQLSNSKIRSDRQGSHMCCFKLTWRVFLLISSTCNPLKSFKEFELTNKNSYFLSLFFVSL